FMIAAFVRSVRVWWRERKSVSAEADFELQFGVFTCIWLVVPVLFFSISQSKLPGYILPAIPAGAVLLADYLRQNFEQELSEREKAHAVSRWLAVLHALAAAAPIIPALLIAYV